MSPEQLRKSAIWFARGRGVIGLVALVAPGVFARAWVGPSGGTRGGKALARFFGVRELTLALGSMIALEASERGSDWLSMAALADAGDAALGLGSRGLPARGRLVALGAGAAAVTQFQLARKLAGLDPGVGE